MKKFIKKLVADVKFSDAGKGRSLNEDAAPGPSNQPQRPMSAPRRPPTSEAQTAAAAALARMEVQNNRQNSGLNAQKLALKRQVERQASQEKQKAAVTTVTREPSVVPQVGLRMLCPICSVSLPKPDINPHFESCLEKQLELEPLKTTCTMIYTLNSGDLLANGVKTLVFFVQNVLKDDTDEKYKKIRVNNTGVQKKIMPLVGGVEFLEIVGFSRIPDETEGEEYFIMLETPTSEHLQLCISTLQNSVKIAPTLDRDVKVLQTTVGTQKFDLSSDFFRVTKEDLKTEQKRKAEEMDKNNMLRTKSMRDRDAGIGMRIYFYTIIRIRFPDGLYLQGTFSAHDTAESVYRFVETSLRQLISFTLVTPGCPPLKRDSALLKASGLVPSGVLNLSTKERSAFTLLSDELVCKLTDL